MVGSWPSLLSWMRAAAARVGIEGTCLRCPILCLERIEKSLPPEQSSKAFSAAGAGFISAIIVNPLDVAKEGFTRLWKGTGASLALSVPTIIEPLPPVQIRRSMYGLIGEEATAASVLGANFSTGFVAGSLAAPATCQLAVAKTYAK